MHDLNTKFEEAKKRLNQSQLKAVETIEGPVMVIAGPGTGKTQVLSLRIANILLKTDTPPENILAITFTESGVVNMRDRLRSIIGAEAYRVSIYTFHGFAEHVIKTYPEYFPKIVGSNAIGDVEKFSLIENIIDRSTLSYLKPFGEPYHYLHNIVSSISELKREGITCAKFEKLVEEEIENFKKIDGKYHEKGVHKGKMKGVYIDLEKQIEKNKDLSLIYKEYEAELEKLKKYDFEDMLLSLSLALDHSEDLKLILGENYQYALIDEHQDSNNAQNSIIEKIFSYHENPNIFVVGDDKQAIFRFQGASIENFYYFRDKYKGAVLVSLSENYRSSQSILDSASYVLSQEGGLKAEAGFANEPISLYPFSSEEIEAFFVAKDIKTKISQGVKPSQIAVIYRNNKDSVLFAKHLDKMGVKYKIESDQDLFSDKDIKKLITILKGVHNFGDNEALADLLHVDTFSLSPLSIHKLIYGASFKKTVTLFEILDNPKLYLKKFKLSDEEKFLSVLSKLSTWKKLSKNDDLLTTVESVFRDSGILDDILTSDMTHERLGNIATFFDEVKNILAANPLASLHDLFVYLDTIKEHKMMVKKKQMRATDASVKLMTAHKSKGLEFEYVYIVKCYSGHFGDKRTVNKLKLIPSIYVFSKKKDISSEEAFSDDERRLFYVALTRAKKFVTITYSKIGANGKEQMPTSYIEDIDKSLIKIESTDDIEKEYDDRFGEMFKATPVVSNHEIVDKEFVSYMLDKRGLSATALNNYLTCPWKFFYENLVRIPHAQTKHQIYGSAIHAALEDLFKHMKTEEVDEKHLIASYEAYLREKVLRQSDLEELLEKGKKSLSHWYKEYSSSFWVNSIVEFRINGVLLDDIVRLTGVLDKVEFVEDSIVRVVDYKTGKPKSRNEIEGKNKNSTPNYYRQLVFYKLLLNEFADGRYNMLSGVIDFIERDEKGKFHKEEFIIEDREVADLRDLIINVVTEIKETSFVDKRCDDEDCKYCEMADNFANRNSIKS